MITDPLKPIVGANGVMVTAVPNKLTTPAMPAQSPAAPAPAPVVAPPLAPPSPASGDAAAPAALAGGAGIPSSQPDPYAGLGIDAPAASVAASPVDPYAGLGIDTPKQASAADPYAGFGIDQPAFSTPAVPGGLPQASAEEKAIYRGTPEPVLPLMEGNLPSIRDQQASFQMPGRGLDIVERAASSTITAAKTLGAGLQAGIVNLPGIKQLLEKSEIGRYIKEKADSQLDALNSHQATLMDETRKYGGLPAEVAQTVSNMAMTTAANLYVLGLKGFAGKSVFMKDHIVDAGKMAAFGYVTEPDAASKPKAAAAMALMALLPVPAGWLPKAWMTKLAATTGYAGLSALMGNYAADVPTAQKIAQVGMDVSFGAITQNQGPVAAEARKLTALGFSEATARKVAEFKAQKPPEAPAADAGGAPLPEAGKPADVPAEKAAPRTLAQIQQESLDAFNKTQVTAPETPLPPVTPSIEANKGQTTAEKNVVPGATIELAPPAAEPTPPAAKAVPTPKQPYYRYEGGEKRHDTAEEGGAIYVSSTPQSYFKGEGSVLKKYFVTAKNLAPADVVASLKDSQGKPLDEMRTGSDPGISFLSKAEVDALKAMGYDGAEGPLDSTGGIREIAVFRPDHLSATKPAAEPTAPAAKAEAMTPESVRAVVSSRRIRGDALENAVDLANDLQGKGGRITPQGNAILYHRTTPENAAAIVRDQRMTSKEDGLFFGTKPNGQIEGYGDAVVEVEVPLEKLELNDVFPDEAHARMATGTIGRKIPIIAREVKAPAPAQPPAAEPGKGAAQPISPVPVVPGTPLSGDKTATPSLPADAALTPSTGQGDSTAKGKVHADAVKKLIAKGYSKGGAEATVAAREAKSLQSETPTTGEGLSREGPGAKTLNPIELVTTGAAEPGRNRLRKLLDTLQRSPKVSETSKQDIAKLDPEYEQQGTTAMKNRVLQWFTERPAPGEVATRVAEAERLVRDQEADLDTKGAVGIALLEHYKATGNDAANLSLVEHLDPLMRGAGRLIQAASMLNKLSGNNWITKMNKYLADKKVELPADIRTEVENGFREAAKIRDEQLRAKAIHKLVAKVSSYVPFLAGDWLDAYRYTNMLSNPQSHERNIYGNLVQGLITRPLALATRGNFSGAKTYFTTAWQNALSGEAFIKAKESFNSDFSKWAETLDDPNTSMFEAVRREQGPQGKAKSVAWKSLTAIPKVLQAQDMFFGSMIDAGEIARLTKKGVSPDDAQRIARRLSDKYLYREKFGTRRDVSLPWASQALDGLASILEKGRTMDNPFIRWPMKLAVPFLRTPMRIAQFSAEASPLAWAGTGMNTKTIAQAKFGKAFEKLSSAEQLIVKEELNNRVGLASVGTMVTLTGLGFALQGKTTWGAPDDEKARELFYASGRRPYSFMVGDRWVPMAYLGPFFVAFAMPAAARDAFADNPRLVDEPFLTRLGAAAAGIPKIILSQTPTSGVNGLLELLQGKSERSLAKTIGFEIGQFIPASGLLRWMTKITDPVYRKPVTVAETIEAGIPGLSDDVKAYQKAHGGNADRSWTDIYLPYTIGKADVNAEKGLKYRNRILENNARQRHLIERNANR